MARFWLLIALLLSGPTEAASILVNSAHGSSQVVSDIIAVKGSGYVDVTVFVDRTTASPSDATFDANIVSDASNTSATFYSQQTSSPVNHATYFVTNNSFAGFTLQTWDLANYAALQTNQIMMSWANTIVQPPNTPPPVTSTTSTATSAPGNFSTPGLEFGIAQNYLGCITTAPSYVTSCMSAILGMMHADHPTWTWGDIKGALRQTASNWSTGYDDTNYGYGAISYTAATAVASTSSIYLQPPVITASVPSPNHLTLTIYPARSSRRDHEVVYLMPATYVWPVKNEYALSDITAANGTLIYTSNNTDLIPTATVSLTTPPGLYDLVGFTTDNLGAYSRHETWTQFSIQDQCL